MMPWLERNVQMKLNGLTETYFAAASLTFFLVVCRMGFQSQLSSWGETEFQEVTLVHQIIFL